MTIIYKVKESIIDMKTIFRKEINLTEFKIRFKKEVNKFILDSPTKKNLKFKNYDDILKFLKNNYPTWVLKLIPKKIKH